MRNTLICFIFLGHILNLLINCEPKVNGPCACPGIPPKARLRDISIETKRFLNGKKVRIDCKNDAKDVFPFYDHDIQCINGRWIGKEPRCGVNLEAQVINMEIFSCSDGYKHSVSNPFNQTEETPGIPLNAFHYKRVVNHRDIPYIRGPECPRYKVIFNENVKIWFLMIELNIEETIESNVSIAAPDLKPFVNEYRSCDLREIKEEVYKEHNSITFAYHFICDLISDTNNTQEEPVNSITFDFNVSEGNAAMVEGIYIGQIYADRSNKGSPKSPKCGKLEMKSIAVVFHEEIGYYLVGCNDSFIDLNRNSTENENPMYRIDCDRNGQWKKYWPTCLPKTPCPTDVLMSEIDDSVIIEEFGNVYYFNESQWFAITDSFVRYSCVDENRKMFDYSVRHCLANGTWSLKARSCRTSDNSVLITGILFVVFVTIVLIVFVTIVLIVFRIHSKRVNTELKRTRNEIKESNKKRFSEELYSDIGNGNLYELGCERMDVYEAIDLSIANQIRNQKQKDNEYLEMKGTDMQLMETTI